MSEFQGAFVARGLICALLLSPLFTSGCTGEIRRWSEEVGLDDGSVIVVDRYAKFRESNSLAGDAYSSTGLNSRLSFREDLSSLTPWEFPLVPLLLYRDAAANEWVVVATTYSCDVWAERGQPVPPYWEFRLKGREWIQTELSQVSIGRRTNLFFDYEPSLPASKLSRELKETIIKKSDFAKDYLNTVTDAKTCTPRAN
jgi:hypothetical protein